MSVAIPLNSYTWIDSSNLEWPICNAKFVYGTLGPTKNVLNSSNSTYYTSYGNSSGQYWGSLDVVNISQGNSNLVELTDFTDGNNNNQQTISVKQSGIYRIRITLSFSGVNFPATAASFFVSFSNVKYIASSSQSNSNIVPFNLNANSIISSLTSNNFLSFGVIYSNYPTNSRGNNMYSSTSTSITYPYFSIFSGTGSSSTSNTLTNNGLSVVEESLYLQANTPLFLNILSSPPPSNSTTYVNATGNFMLELLSIPNPIITNVSGTTNSGIQFSNGYRYIEFYPSAIVATASIIFPSDVNLNYLLIGGGGGASGGYFYIDSRTGDTAAYAGGGGGGGSAINGSYIGISFNISVGYLGVGGNGNVYGSNGYNSSIGTTSNTNVAIAYGGGGAYAGSYSKGGGVVVPVPDPSGNGTIYNATNGGNGYINNNNVEIQTPSSGSNGYIISLPFKTYSIGGAGGGGSLANSGNGGLNNEGGAGPGSGTGNGEAGSGYGTGGGGARAGYYNNIYGTYTDYAGGNGSSGIVVLYWQ